MSGTRPDGVISKADEARLMFLAHDLHHSFLPLTPFAPCGSTLLRACALDVQIHASCGYNHRLKYAGWSWHGQDKTSIWQESATGSSSVEGEGDDGSVCAGLEGIKYTHLDRERDCSETLTRSAFLWLRGDYGYPINEREIYQHEWIDDEESSDEDADIAEGDGKSRAGTGLGRRLSKTMTMRSASI